MLNKNQVLFWNEVEYDLYTEGGLIFGVELDLFNNHKSYYCKSVKDGKELIQYLNDDIYIAIEEFNSML